jgi:hypothetical protein
MNNEVVCFFLSLSLSESGSYLFVFYLRPLSVAQTDYMVPNDRWPMNNEFWKDAKKVILAYSNVGHSAMTFGLQWRVLYETANNLYLRKSSSDYETAQINFQTSQSKLSTDCP